MKKKIPQLSDYRAIISEHVMAEIWAKAQQLSDVTVVHVNATNHGGGVAEILNNLILLMNDVGLRTDWRVLHGIPEFFEVTKKFHNALQGQDVAFTDEELDLYQFINEKFAHYAFLDCDVAIIHDPQPCALVRYVEHSAPWIWRCHIDITHPNERAWRFLQPFTLEYEQMIVSSEDFKHFDLDVPQEIIMPSIDPLALKNMSLSDETIGDYLERYHIPGDKPLVTQVSRLDPWKDPEGVLKVYERVKEQVDCRLVYCYNLASDDPEGARIYERMLRRTRSQVERGEILFVRGDDPVLVNALQRASGVILQKSTREGFGLTVTEAMWKETPVVASNVGGIPVQIWDGVTGFLVEPQDIDGCAEKVVQLLEDRDLAGRIGRQAREHVRENFLITRHLLDYLNLLLTLV